MSALVEIRIPDGLGPTLRAHVFASGPYEPVAFALASHATVDGRIVLLVRELIPLSADAYEPTAQHGAKWRGRAMLGVLNAALARRLGVLIFHAHDQTGPVALSPDDWQSAAQLLPTFQSLIPDRPHGSVVLGKDRAAGTVLLPGTGECQDSAVRVQWIGNPLRCSEPSVRPRAATHSPDETFHRQVLLIGGAGQASLEATTVAVVGLCGGGSHVVQQLAHLGVGEIIGIDPDQAEIHNRSRMIGLEVADVRERRLKTDVMARLVYRINPRVRFTPIPQAVPEPETLAALKRSRIIVGCVDSLHARADLQAIAWRYLIPYVDIGLRIEQLGREHHDISIGGNVLTLTPGQFCMWCVGFLSEAKLLADTGGQPRSYLKNQRAEAQVVSFNGVLASQAVNEVLNLLTGFASDKRDMGIKKFDGIAGTLMEWKVKQNPQCPICTNELGAGDPVWRTP